MIPSEQEEQGKKPSLLSFLGDRFKKGWEKFDTWNQKAGESIDRKWDASPLGRSLATLDFKHTGYQPPVMGLNRATLPEHLKEEYGYGEGQRYGKSHIDEKNKWHSGVESQMATPAKDNKSVNQQALTSMNNATTAIGDSGNIDPTINNFVTPGQEMDPGGKDWGGHENIKPELLLNKFGTSLDGDTGWQQDPNQVRMLQQSLTKSGYGDLLGPSGVDAKYGPATDTALRTYMATLQRGPSFEGPGF